MGNDGGLAPREPHRAQFEVPVFAPSTVTLQRADSRSEFDLQQIIRILHKNWRYAAVFALTTISVITIISFRMPDLYEPIARLEIDPPGSEAISLKDLLNSGSNDQDYLETQSRILQSDELAVAVIRSLRLDQNPELVGKRALLEDGSQADESPSATQLTRSESQAVRSFQARSKVSKVRNSRLVEVSFASHDPALASQVTNTLVNFFIDRNYRARYESTMQASEWLSGQLSDLRQKVEQSTRALVEYQKNNGGVLNELDSEGQSSLGRKIWDLTDHLVQAQADRIHMEAALRMAEEGRAESLPFSRNSYFLQVLLSRFADTRNQLADALAVYGKNHSLVKRLQNQLAEQEVQVTVERQKVIDELKTSYEQARRRERLATQALEDLKGVISNVNERKIKYTLLKNEAEANQDLYSTLLAKLKEAGISAGLKSSNIHVVDQARVLDRPTRPNRPLNIAMGFFAGVLGGLIFAFVIEKLDNTVHTPDDVTECAGFPSLALLPLWGSTNGRRLLAPLQQRALKLLGNGGKAEQPASTPRLFLDTPHSPEAEAIQSLYTSIMLSRPGKPPRVILVASASPSEGKTTVSANLASVLARHARTCLTETDLRRPAVAPLFGLTQRQGLSNVLTGSVPLETVMATAPQVPNLTVLLAGPTPPNPAELLASEAMRELIQSLRGQFEYVVLDSPPIIPFADARSLAALADGVIVVGRCGHTTRQAVIRTAEILESARAHVLGFVINGVNLSSPDYRYYQYGSYYGYGDAYSYEVGGRNEKQEQVEEKEDDIL